MHWRSLMRRLRVRVDHRPCGEGLAERKRAATLYIEPGSPWENGYIESFNGKLSDEVLDGEIFDTLLEAKVLIERYRVRYNTVRPHSSLGYRPPAPEAIVPWTPGLGASLLGPAPMAGPVGTLT